MCLNDLSSVFLIQLEYFADLKACQVQLCVLNDNSQFYKLVVLAKSD